MILTVFKGQQIARQCSQHFKVMSEDRKRLGYQRLKWDTDSAVRHLYKMLTQEGFNVCEFDGGVVSFNSDGSQTMIMNAKEYEWKVWRVKNEHIRDTEQDQCE